MQVNKLTQRSTRYFRNGRRGAAAVEAAILCPLLVLLILGAMDIGQFVNVQQSVSNASREGARIACRSNTANVGEVEARVHDYLIDAFPKVPPKDLVGAIGVKVTDANGTPIQAGDIESIESGASVFVRVTLDYHAVRWIPSVFHWNVSSNETTTIGRRE